MANGPDIYVFELNGRYLFKRYFEADAVFDALSDYYVRDEYRFEVPTDAFDAVAETLREYGFEPTVVDDPEPYCVVIGQYEKHADILKASVANWTRREHRFFLMQDPFALEHAVQRGARPVAETEFEAGI
jgi:hypothetical protein